MKTLDRRHPGWVARLGSIVRQNPGRGTLLLWCAGIGAFNLALLVALVARVPSSATLDNIAQFVGPLLTLPLCGLGPLRAGRDADRRQWVAALVGLGCAGFSVGQIVWTYYELVLQQNTPFPSLADVFFSASYPCLLAAVIFLPPRRLSVRMRLRVVLDGLMILTALMTISWYFVLGPTLMQPGESVLARVIGTSYPAWDVALLACVLVVMPLMGRGAQFAAGLVIALGLVCEVAADSGFDYGTLQGTYRTGNLIDVLWPLSYMVMALGAGVLRGKGVVLGETVAGTDEQPLSRRRRAWLGFLPYVLLVPAAALFVYVVHQAHDAALRPGVEIGGGCLLVLVLVRQLLAMLENSKLSLRLQQQNEQLEEANRRLQELATTDPHTGLPNHRALVGAVEGELERAFRYTRPCSILFADIDHFKTVNDGLGHAAGDVVLNQVAESLRSNLRTIDVLGRWGGEEFVVLLPETDRDEALEVGERLRRAVADHLFTVGTGLRLTCSIGSATYPRDSRDGDVLMELADRAMYGAKRLGRNQVRSATDPAVQAIETTGTGESRDTLGLVGVVEALSALVDARDQYTGEHSVEVAGLAVRLAIALGLDAGTAHRVGLCGRLHDVGKVAVPDAILRKPGRLSAEEWALVRNHTTVGADVLARMPALRNLAPIVRAHHERWDGSGYPDGLRAEEIPLEARIVNVADAFTAITSDRPYRARRTQDEALEELSAHEGSQFDPGVVEALRRVIGSSGHADRRIAS